MVNEEKIRLMTKAAAFESGEGKKALEMNRFFRSDYISLHLIGAWVSYTVAFILCVGLWVFYKMEYLLTNLHKMDLVSLGKGLALLYAALLGIYLIIQYIVYSGRYQENRKKLTAYNHILKHISDIYQSESGSTSTTEGAKEE